MAFKKVEILWLIRVLKGSLRGNFSEAQRAECSIMWAVPFESFAAVRKAKAKRDVVMAKIEQEENNHRRSIYLSVSQFNNQRGQCLVSAKTAELARERYVLVSDRFRQGKATVTDLIDAQTEKDTAELKHISDMCNYWTYYYRLRKSTLYDFIKQSDIIVDFEQIQNR